MRFLLFLLAFASLACAEPKRIFYSSGAPAKVSVFTSRADGTDERAPLQPGNLGYNPAWPPDGQWIASTSARDGSADLYRVTVPVWNGLTDYAGYDDQSAFFPGQSPSHLGDQRYV